MSRKGFKIMYKYLPLIFSNRLLGFLSFDVDVSHLDDFDNSINIIHTQNCTKEGFWAWIGNVLGLYINIYPWFFQQITGISFFWCRCEPPRYQSMRFRPFSLCFSTPNFQGDSQMSLRNKPGKKLDYLNIIKFIDSKYCKAVDCLC